MIIKLLREKLRCNNDGISVTSSVYDTECGLALITINKSSSSTVGEYSIMSSWLVMVWNSHLMP